MTGNYWFPFNIGKYLQDAGSLAQGEHGAYLMLMLHYYGSKESIPDSRKYLMCRSETQQDTQQVDYVLKRYFKLRDGCWFHNEIERTLSSMQNRAETSRNNGTKGGRPKTQQVLSGLPRENPRDNLDPNQLQQHLKLQKEKHLKEERGGTGGGFSIMKFLTEEVYEAARSSVPGWDINILAKVFDKNVNSGKFEHPHQPGKAFVAWCPVYTKRKRPQ